MCTPPSQVVAETLAAQFSGQMTVTPMAGSSGTSPPDAELQGKQLS